MQNLLETLRGSPVFNQSVEVFATLANGIDEGTEENFAKKLSNRIVFLGMNSVAISKEVWSTMETALAKNRLITFNYSFYDGSDFSKSYTIEPWQLIYSQGMWSLYGKDLHEKKTKFFNLPLVSNVQLKKETFELPPDFEYTKRVKGNFGRYIGNETYDFKIRINSDITANYIKTYKWADDQRFETQADVSVLMTFSSNQYYPVLNWGLSHGQWVVPLEPEKLLDEWNCRYGLTVNKIQALLKAGYNADVIGIQEIEHTDEIPKEFDILGNDFF